MKKIPTLFERDWKGDRSRVTSELHKGCEWVLDGAGVATRKFDGTCCLIRDGKLLKRRELRKDDAVPVYFEKADFDAETEKTIGWMPVGDGRDDQWHREALAALRSPQDGTYELVGPKVQGNPEKFAAHMLLPHALAPQLHEAPRTFDELREWLRTKDIEGIVWHHPDGRMAKIKLRDFGLKRPAAARA